MSRKQAALAGLLGIVGGALAGSPYLDDAGACTAAGSNAYACAMNQAIGPFISALAIGFCVAVVIGHAISLIVRRALAPRPTSRPSRRAAVEVDDPSLQVAAWGLPPGARERIGAASSQVVGQVVELASRRPAKPERPAYEPILEHDPRIRPADEVGRIGARGKPLPTPRSLAPPLASHWAHLRGRTLQLLLRARLGDLGGGTAARPRTTRSTRVLLGLGEIGEAGRDRARRACISKLPAPRSKPNEKREGGLA